MDIDNVYVSVKIYVSVAQIPKPSLNPSKEFRVDAARRLLLPGRESIIPALQRAILL